MEPTLNDHTRSTCGKPFRHRAQASRHRSIQRCTQSIRFRTCSNIRFPACHPFARGLMFLSKSASVLTVLTLAVGIVAAQDSTPRYRTFISDTTLPGVDTGMRDKDAPRPPRPYSADVITRSSGEAYLRGSIAVKFRPGTAPVAERQMMDRIGATTMEAPPYA